ncbi:triose-phosphate isomerase family protein [Agromyces sp. NPDC056523]|uniref:triose-phosphate isomerase family protein n=1 Tax=Agromyces sp. NPDC056523 TaxID=3345850 RepID=UPI0036730CBD
MARPPLLIGSSLKMYFGPGRSLEWTRDVAERCATHPAVRDGIVQPFVIPSFPSIPLVGPVASAAGMLVGAQDVHWEDSGAYTGEVSAPELAEHGVSLVEVGHAERRAMFGETDDTVARKVAATLRHGMTPLVCVGEAERGRADDAAAACIAQLEASVALARTRDGGSVASIVIAYEPVWAIGASEPASDAHIRAVGSALRAHLADDSAFREARVIYGGSAGPGLWPRIADSLDGMFLGRFAHDPAAFARILDDVVALEATR